MFQHLWASHRFRTVFKALLRYTAIRRMKRADHHSALADHRKALLKEGCGRWIQRASERRSRRLGGPMGGAAASVEKAPGVMPGAMPGAVPSHSSGNPDLTLEVGSSTQPHAYSQPYMPAHGHAPAHAPTPALANPGPSAFLLLGGGAGGGRYGGRVRTAPRRPLDLLMDTDTNANANTITTQPRSPYSTGYSPHAPPTAPTADPYMHPSQPSPSFYGSHPSPSPSSIPVPGAPGSRFFPEPTPPPTPHTMHQSQYHHQPSPVPISHPSLAWVVAGGGGAVSHAGGYWGNGGGAAARDSGGDGGSPSPSPQSEGHRTPQRIPQHSAPSTPLQSGVARSDDFGEDVGPATPLSAARAMNAAAAEIAVLERELMKIKQQKAKWGADRKRSRGTDEEAEVMQRYVSWKSAVAPCIKHSAARIATLRKHQQSVQARVQSAG